MEPVGRSTSLKSEQPDTAQSTSPGPVSSSRDAKIVVDSVEKTFPRGRLGAHVVFHPTSFTVSGGEFIALIGPSGGGKTTMLNMIAGLTPVTAGRILINGTPVTGPGRDRGVVFQQDAIFMWRTVRKNVEYGLELQGLARKERRRRADTYIHLVGLQGFEDYYPKELSGGMKKRVAIATVFANQPEVLLMDEPFGSLDYPTKIALQDELLHIYEREGTTTVFVTHELEEAVYLADRVLVLAGGRIAEDIRVPFDRPRASDLRVSHEMQEMKKALWGYL